MKAMSRSLFFALFALSVSLTHTANSALNATLIVSTIEGAEILLSHIDYHTYFTDTSLHCVANNDTEQVLHSALTRCANPHYRLRALHPSQVSLRKTSTPIPPSNSTANASSPASGSVNSSTTIVHSYLALALLQDNHPPSSALYTSLSRAAPLYPSLTILTGNVYDFAEVTSQYHVSSFPKGIFEGFLPSEARSTAEVIVALSSWLRVLPAAIPIAIPPLTYKTPTDNRRTAADSLWHRFHTHLANLQNSLLGPPLEPVISISRDAGHYEVLIFLASVVYFVVWMGMIYYDKSPKLS